MGLVLVAVAKYLAKLSGDGVRIRIVGDRSQVSDKLRDAWEHAESSTRHNTRITLSVAFNYGGRWDIVQACRQAIAAGVAPDDLDESKLNSYMALSYAPDPDLFIRTGGEVRISNFLLWQAAYSELVFTDCLWPEFGPDRSRRGARPVRPPRAPLRRPCRRRPNTPRATPSMLKQRVITALVPARGAASDAVRHRGLAVCIAHVARLTRSRLGMVAPERGAGFGARPRGCARCRVRRCVLGRLGRRGAGTGMVGRHAGLGARRRLAAAQRHGRMAAAAEGPAGRRRAGAAVDRLARPRQRQGDRDQLHPLGVLPGLGRRYRGLFRRAGVRAPQAGPVDQSRARAGRASGAAWPVRCCSRSCGCCSSARWRSIRRASTTRCGTAPARSSSHSA